MMTSYEFIMHNSRFPECLRLVDETHDVRVLDSVLLSQSGKVELPI